MYVTAAGKEEQASKGKKAISYAVIGVLIIMGSFAIVNTVLQAPGGKEGATQGAAPTGSSSSGTTQQRFNILANRVSTIAQNLLTAYQFHFEALKQMDGIKTLATCTGASDATKCTTPDLFSKSLANAINNVGVLENYVNTNSVDTGSINAALDDLKADLNLYVSGVMAATDDAANGISPIPSECSDKILPLDLMQCRQDQQTKARNDVISKATYDTSTKYTDALNAVKSNFGSEVRSEKLALKEMYAQVSPITDVAETQFLALITDKSFLQNTDLIPQQSLIDGAAGPLAKTRIRCDKCY